MNETIKNLKERRSIRKYKRQNINEAELDQILEAGIYAPSGMNRQSVILVAVSDKKQRDELSFMNADVMGSENDPFYGAPHVVIVLADSSCSTWIEDGALAIGNMMNAAFSLGVGSCWVHRAKQMFDSEKGSSLIAKWGLEEKYRGVGCCILGYADEIKEAAPRREGRIIKI